MLATRKREKRKETKSDRGEQERGPDRVTILLFPILPHAFSSSSSSALSLSQLGVLHLARRHWSARAATCLDAPGGRLAAADGLPVADEGLDALQLQLVVEPVDEGVRQRVHLAAGPVP